MVLAEFILDRCGYGWDIEKELFFRRLKNARGDVGERRSNK